MVTPKDNNLWKYLLGALVGALVPSLVAWGSMSAEIENIAAAVSNKLNKDTFEEYKEGNIKLLEAIRDEVKRIADEVSPKNNRK